MPSLKNLALLHAPLLVLDAASAQIQVGIWDADGPGAWHISADEAGIGLFRGIEKLDVRPEAIGAFVFCEGPGSTLGIRTAAMAIRTWTMLAGRPMFSYSSLAVVAHALRRPELNVIADARRDSWHRFRLGGKLERIPTADLGGDLVMPEHFRHWSALPAQVERTPYAVRELLAATTDVDLLRIAETPDAFLYEEPNYVTWTPQVHRAP